MVKLGIICEGESETIIFNSGSFKKLLKEFSIELIGVQETGSKNQFFEGRFEKHKKTMQEKGARFIFALFDLDKDDCLVKLKESSDLTQNEFGIISIKEFESWYLADQNALSNYLKKEINIEFPENIVNPDKEIIRLNNGKGFGRSKPLLAKKMLSSGFSIQNAANHPNCSSAQYFMRKLKLISNL